MREAPPVEEAHAARAGRLLLAAGAALTKLEMLANYELEPKSKNGGKDEFQKRYFANLIFFAARAGMCIFTIGEGEQTG